MSSSPSNNIHTNSIDLSAVHSLMQRYRGMEYGQRMGRRLAMRLIRLASGLLGMFLVISIMLPIAAGADVIDNSKPTKQHILIALSIQGIGATLLLGINQWRQSMLPGPYEGAALLVLTGSCCFGDEILSGKQAMLLFASQCLQMTGIYFSMVGMLYMFLQYLTYEDDESEGDDQLGGKSGNDDQNDTVNIIIMFTMAIPAIIFYYTLRSVYRCVRKPSQRAAAYAAAVIPQNEEEEAGRIQREVELA